MTRKLSLSSQAVALIFIFIFLFCRLLIGCDRDQATSPTNLKLGDSAPDFAAKDLDGNVVVLSSLKEGPLILRFFETNCRFCKADTPIFTTFYQKHRAQGLNVLYIGSFYENEASLRAFVNELGTTFPVVMDNGAKLADLYGIRVYPQTIFLGPDRKILAAILGAVSDAELIEILGKYF